MPAQHLGILSSRKKIAVVRKGENKNMTTGKDVSISQEELDELRKLQSAAKTKKAASQGKSKARTELIKKYRPEYDALVKQFGGK